MSAYAVLILAYVLSQFYRSFLAVMVTILEIDLGVTPSELSRASGALFVVFALMQFPIGIALDRYGPRATTSLLLTIGGAWAQPCLPVRKVRCNWHWPWR